MKLRRPAPPLSLVVVALIWLLFVFPSATRAGGNFFPKGTNITSIVVISESNLTNSAQKTLIATLQGIVARQSAQQIYIDGGNGYSLWDNHLNTTYAIPYTVATTPWSLLTQFKGDVSGYILFDKTANSNSLNVATSLCGPLNAIAVDASIESTVRSYGITNRLADVRSDNDAWTWANYNAVLNRNVVAEQKTDFDDDLRDYAAMANLFIFFDGNTPFRNSIVSQLNPDSACLGWGDASQGESVFVGDSSSNGVFTCASDWALDLSTLSGIRDTSFYQRTYSQPVAETNVHYVTFVMSDGDNVQWNLGGEPGLYNNPARGAFNMGWSLSSSLADLAPSVLRWYYDYASTTTNRDFFVAGPSGVGYMYPSDYPSADLALHVQKLNYFMGRADMNIGQIIDFSSFSRLDLWNQYLAQPNIAALLYLEYTQYNGAGGAVEFSTNGRPVIACRDLLNAGEEDPPTLISNIDSCPADISSPDGYTFVCVNVWSETQASVQQVIAGLDSNVRVVTPDVFVRLIRDNVGRKLNYDFPTSLQGWTGHTSGGYYDKAWWTNNVGNPAGCLLMDGSHLGVPSTNVNSWFTRQIILPQNATGLSFDTMAANDGLLQVQLQTPGGNMVTLLPWAGLSTPNAWSTLSAGLAQYAGQTVTLYFQQMDGGQGSGEYRYVDNVNILTSGSPVYLPDAPKLLSASGATNVMLLWRNNDENETGFSVERNDGTGGDWNVIATVASNVTIYADNSIKSGGDYSYRLRSFNAAGYSPYSNVLTNGPLPRRFLLGPGNGSFEGGGLNWNSGGPGGSAGSVNFENAGTNGVSAPGDNCVLETSDGSLGATGNGVDFRANDFSLDTAANGAQPVTFSFDYNILNPIHSANQIRVGLRFEDAAGDFLGEHNSYIGTPNGDTGAQGWKHFSVTTTPTANALSADIRVSMNVFGDDTWNNGPVLFDNFTVIAGSNSPPVVSNVTMGTLTNLPVTRLIIGGPTGAINPNGDSMTVTYVSQPANGVASTDGSSITYIPRAGYVGSDAFSFAVSDGLGGLTIATATAHVSGTAGANQFTGAALAGANNMTLSFSGAPFCGYVLESADNLTPPVVWTPISTNTAAVNGSVRTTIIPSGPATFWRMRLLP